MKFPTLAFLGITTFFSMQASANITITGLPEPVENNARSLIRLASTSCDTAQWRVERLYRNMDKQLRDALRALGHYQYEFDKTLSFDDSACWSATLEVTLGDPVLLRDVSVNITGDAQNDSAILRRINPRMLLPESVLNHGEYETFKQFVMSMLKARGYFAAMLVEHSVVVDESLSFADIHLEVDSGPRYAYDDVAIAELYESLNGSGYFSSVSIDTEPATDGSYTVPVFISLSPGVRRIYTTGLGYATDIGLQGRLGYTNRRRNSKGHQFRTSVRKPDDRGTGELGNYRHLSMAARRSEQGMGRAFRRIPTKTNRNE